VADDVWGIVGDAVDIVPAGELFGSTTGFGEVMGSEAHA